MGSYVPQGADYCSLMFTQSYPNVIITGHGPRYEWIQAAFEGRMACVKARAQKK